MFYNQLKKICALNGTTPTALVKELGLGSSNVTRWKNGATVNSDILLKISEYFKVSTDYLITGKEGGTNLTNDETELLDTYRKLDSRGRHMLHIKAYEESDRMTRKANIAAFGGENFDFGLTLEQKNRLHDSIRESNIK